MTKSWEVCINSLFAIGIQIPELELIAFPDYCQERIFPEKALSHNSNREAELSK